MATNFSEYFVFDGNGHTYKAMQQRLTWQSAKDMCEAKGGHLAVVSSPAVQSFLETFISDPVWIGGYSPDGSNTNWKWVDGTPFTWANWATGQPDNTGETGIQIGVGSSWSGGKWNNWTATAACYYVCEWDTDITGESLYEGLDVVEFEQWATAPVKPFILRGKLHPADEVMAECRFYDDQFKLDFEHDVRTSTIHLIKGSAVQINRPSAALHIVQVGNGVFLSKQDYLTFNRLYYSNLIGEPEPYPTEFLVLREEDYELVMPDGYIYSVSFAETPSITPQKVSQGRWLYTFNCKFRIVPDEDEQEEL